LGVLYCGREEDEDEEDMIGGMSSLSGEDSGRRDEGATISIVECRGGLHLVFLKSRNICPNLSMSHTEMRCNVKYVKVVSAEIGKSILVPARGNRKEIISNQKKNLRNWTV
jgi:hypothetical protein